MPFLSNDRLDPAQSHGDLLLALSADQPDDPPPRPAPAHAPDQGQPGPPLDAQRLQPPRRQAGARPDRQPQPARLQGRHGQPRHHRQGADGRADLGRRRGRRARLGRRRRLPGGPHHPHVRRVLGPHPERAAEDHRPRQDQRRPARPGPRDRRPRLRRRRRRPGPPRRPHPHGQPAHAESARNRIAAARPQLLPRLRRRRAGGSTRGWPSSATSGA